MTAVIYETAPGGVCTITMNRPEKLNAINDELDFELRASLRRLDEDESARVAVLTGAGRAFCAGADVLERQTRTQDEMERRGGPSGSDVVLVPHLLRAVRYKPVIAAAHGYAIGAGLRILLTADIVICSADARFQVTEVPRGLHGTLQWALLRERCGDAFATDVALTGRYWGAHEALDRGMVAEVVEDGDDLARALAVATTIAAHPEGAVQALVRSRRSRLESTMAWSYRATEAVHLFRTEEFQAQARGFVNRNQDGQRHTEVEKHERS